MTVLFWDIDGTLLTTGKAGVPAWEAAVREVTGHDFQLASIRVAGLTDYQIAVRTFEMLGVDPDDATVRRDGSPVRGAAAGLAAVEARFGAAERPRDSRAPRTAEDVRSYLLTGNTRGGARAKLTHYRLCHFFPDGAFAEDAGERATIAARALELARRAGPVADDSVFVIGDTPHDIHCANAIGARTIAVGTGGYTVEELAEHRPWRVFAELPAVGRVPAADRARSIRAGRRRCTRRWRPPPVRVQRLLRRFPRLWRATRLARRWYHARYDAYPDWRPILQANSELWSSARASAQGGPRVLMATAIGSYAHAVTLESALAAALTFRGAEVHALLCDGSMTACAECEASLYPNIERFARHGPSRDLCRDCLWPAERVYASSASRSTSTATG